MKRNFFKIVVLFFVNTSNIFALTPPNASSIENDLNIPNINHNKNNGIKTLNDKKFKEPLSDDKTGDTIFIKDFIFDGNTKISSKELNKLLDEFKNRYLTFYDIQALATIITKEYRNKGFFVAKAYIPVQKLEDSILTISVIEGEYGVFSVENNSLVKTSIIKDIFDEAKKEKVLSISALERQLYIANNLSGIYINKAQIKAGKSQGSSDFDIQAQKTSRLNGFILADNYGSRYTGKNRIITGIDINSPFKLGDKLSFVGLNSGIQDLNYYNLSYESLLLPNGLKGGIGYSYTKYSLINEYEDLDANGDAKVLSLNISYPHLIKDDKELISKIEYSYKKMNDYIDLVDIHNIKNINKSLFELNYKEKSNLYFPIQSNYTLSYTYGNLNIKDEISSENDKDGAKTNGDYSKLFFKTSQKIYLKNNLTLDAIFKYQHSLSNKNLDGSEDLSIGGENGVKVYPSGESSGENGYIFTLHPKYQLQPLDNINHSIGLFYDRAKVYYANTTNITQQTKTLQDSGISYEARYKDFFLNSYIAWRINSDKIISEPEYNSKFLIQTGWIF